MSANDKRCRQCRQSKPIREFTLPRHRLCTACRTGRNIDLVEAWIAGRQSLPPASPDPAAVWAAQKSGQLLEPGGKVPGLTMTWEGSRKYARDRARQIRLEKEQDAAKQGKPVHTPTYRTVKVCVRCHAHKHVLAFHNPRYRVCMACDGPKIIQE